MTKIAIGKSIYEIACRDGEEEKLQKLAAKLNQRVNNLSLHLKDLDEKNLLVITALLLEEEIESKKPTTPNNNESSNLTEDDIYDSISENMDNISSYIEKLARNIKQY